MADPGQLDKVDVLPRGDRLLVTLFHSIGTNKRLLALEAATGKPVWESPVANLPPYRREPFFINLVTPELLWNSVMLTGSESPGPWVQAFDADTGRPWLTEMQLMW